MRNNNRINVTKFEVSTFIIRSIIFNLNIGTPEKTGFENFKLKVL